MLSVLQMHIYACTSLLSIWKGTEPSMERATANTYTKKGICLQQPLFIRKYSYRLENLAVVLRRLCNVPCQVQSTYRYLCFGCNAAPIKLHGMNIQRKWEFIWSNQGLSVKIMPRNCNLELYVGI